MTAMFTGVNICIYVQLNVFVFLIIDVFNYMNPKTEKLYPKNKYFFSLFLSGSLGFLLLPNKSLVL